MIKNNKAHVLHPIHGTTLALVIISGVITINMARNGAPFLSEMIVIFAILAMLSQFTHTFLDGIQVIPGIATLIIFFLVITLLRASIGNSGALGREIYDNILYVAATIMILDFVKTASV